MRAIGSECKTRAARDIARSHNNTLSSATALRKTARLIRVLAIAASGCGPGHDVIELPSSDFTSLADVFRHTGDIQGSAWITDPVTHDTIRLVGVTSLTESEKRLGLKAGRVWRF